MSIEDDASKQSTNESQIDLTNLWKQQSKLAIDVDSIRQQAISQTRKQRFYILIDVLSLSPILLLFFIDLKLSPILKGFLAVNFCAAFLAAAYFIKLRCLSAFGNDTTIEEYKTSLLQQLKNNAKIAFINKHMCWIVMIALSALVLISAWHESWAVEQTLKKMAISLGLVSVILIPWYFWANERQKRFEKEALELKNKIMV
jgi:Flp pilus assembly protein TadB